MWSIEPGVSVGPFSLGMKEEDYVARLGQVVDVFKRTPQSENDVIAYDDAGVHLSVDRDRRVRQISVFTPNEVCFFEIQLLGRNISDVAKDMSRMGLEFRVVDAGLWCAAANIMLVEVDGLIDGVEMGCTGPVDSATRKPTGF